MTSPSDSLTPPHPLHRRLLEQLQLERSAHGHGAAARLDARLGKSEGYFGRVLRGEIGLQTEQLFKMLEALEVEPAAFFTRVVGSAFSPRRFLKHWARAQEREPSKCALPISQQRLESLRNLLQTQQGKTQGNKNPNNGAGLLPHRARNDQQLDSRARHVAELHFSAGKDTLEAAAELLTTAHGVYLAGRVSGSTLATVLQLAASIERWHGHAATALLFLRTALEVVDRPSPVEIGLLVEAVDHLLPEGQLVAADLMIDAAQRRAIHLRGDQVSGRHALGKTLLARGSIDVAGRRPAEALSAFETGLEYLHAEDWPSHVLGHLGAARSQLDAADPFHAGRHLARAEALHKTRCGPHWAALLWAKGDWKSSGGASPADLKMAAALYGDALDALDAPRQPMNAATLHLRQSQILLALGAPERVRRSAAAALQLTAYLKKAPAVRELLLQFATLAMTGELTERWLENAVQGMTAIELPNATTGPSPTPRTGRLTGRPSQSGLRKERQQ